MIRLAVRRAGAVGVTMPLLAGCADSKADGEDAPEAVVRDSAGVIIVENPASTDATPVWFVDPAPQVDIGVLEGAPEYQLEEVRSAARLSNGTIVVPDGGAHVLRFYDAEGGHIRTVGGEGSGPGEFRSVRSTMIGPGDSIHVWDSGQRRLSVFSPAGDFVRSFSIQQATGIEFRLHALTLLGHRLVTAPGRPVLPGDPGGIFRDTLPLFVHSPAGEIVDTLGPWPSREVFIRSDERSASVTGRPFGRMTFFAVFADTLYVADSDRWQVEVHDVSGLRRIVRSAVPNRSVTQSDIDAFKRERLAEADDEWRELAERIMAEVPFPETMPAFGQIMVDERAHLWVQDYAPPYIDEPVAWTIFDPKGRRIARASIPAGLLVTQIGEDWVLGVWQDEFDVQHVRVHRLDRHDSPNSAS